jgi:hypothetical protein
MFILSIPVSDANSKTFIFVKAPFDLEPIKAYNHDGMESVSLLANDNRGVE